MKTCLFSESFVDASRNEQKETACAPQRQFVISHWPRNHHRIGEHGALTGSQNPLPFLEHTQPIWEMVHRVDTHERIERVVIKRQGCIRVGYFEAWLMSLVWPDRTLSGCRDAAFIRVYAGDMATDLI